MLDESPPCSDGAQGRAAQSLHDNDTADLLLQGYLLIKIYEYTTIESITVREPPNSTSETLILEFIFHGKCYLARFTRNTECCKLSVLFGPSPPPLTPWCLLAKRTGMSLSLFEFFKFFSRFSCWSLPVSLPLLPSARLSFFSHVLDFSLMGVAVYLLLHSRACLRPAVFSSP